MDNAAYYCPYIPLRIVTLEKPKMKLRFQEMGEQRWVCYVSASSMKDIHELRDWLDEHLTDRYLMDRGPIDVHDMIKAQYNYTIRGGDVRDKTLIALRWSNGS